MPQPARTNRPRRSVLIYTVHKAASSFLERLTRKLTAHLGIEHHSAADRKNRKEIFDAGWGRFIESGNKTGCFGPIRLGAAEPSVPNDLEKYSIVVHMRDPRDILTSYYYSHTYSHNRGLFDPGDAARQRWEKMGVDKYVLCKARGGFQTRWQPLVSELYGKDNLLLLKYEELVTDYRSWLSQFLTAFSDWMSPKYPEKSDQIDKRSLPYVEKFFYEKFRDEFASPEEEDIYSHKRQVTPGDHCRKLKPQTVVELNAILGGMLSRLGYAADVPDPVSGSPWPRWRMRTPCECVVLHPCGRLGTATMKTALMVVNPHLPVVKAPFLHPYYAKDLQTIASHAACPSRLQRRLHIQLDRGRRMGKLLQQEPPVKCCILGEVRDPLDFVISAFFQRLPYFLPDLSFAPDQQDAELARVIECFHQLFSYCRGGCPAEPLPLYAKLFLGGPSVDRYCDSWSRTYGIDVQAMPRAEPGVTHFHHAGQLHVLYRFEDLPNCLGDVLRRMGQIDEVPIIETELEAEPHAPLYEVFKKQFVPTREMWDFYYDSPYFRHFYPGETTAFPPPALKSRPSHVRAAGRKMAA